MLKKSNVLNIKREKGFTLVELSMVLLIISLLVGGAFKVVSMVENAKVDRLINDLIGFQVSYYSYLNRLGDYPGNGSDMDHIIDYDAVGVNDGTFFQDLFDQGFIKNPEPMVTVMDAGGFYATYLPISASVGLTTGTILGKNQVCVTYLNKADAKQLDNSLDDGVWNTGTVRTTADFDSLATHTLCLQI